MQEAHRSSRRGDSAARLVLGLEDRLGCGVRVQLHERRHGLVEGHRVQQVLELVVHPTRIELALGSSRRCEAEQHLGQQEHPAPVFHPVEVGLLGLRVVALPLAARLEHPEHAVVVEVVARLVTPGGLGRCPGAHLGHCGLGHPVAGGLQVLDGVHLGRGVLAGQRSRGLSSLEAGGKLSQPVERRGKHRLQVAARRALRADQGVDGAGEVWINALNAVKGHDEQGAEVR